MRAAMLACLIGGVTAAAQTPAVSPHLKQLEGHWKPESVQFDGKEQLDAKAKQALTLWIKDAEYRMFYVSDPAKDLHFRLFTADLALDPATKTFALTVKDGQKKGEKRHGIYEVKGDKLTVCYGPAEKPRPTTFATTAGSECFCEVWVKEKK
ncbi:MAG: TIGR03067 domain-containing protein [Gemmataceae bacterium]